MQNGANLVHAQQHHSSCRNVVNYQDVVSIQARPAGTFLGKK